MGFERNEAKEGEQFVRLSAGAAPALGPTLSPKDPGVTAGRESADGLLVQAMAAEDEEKDSEAFSLYGRAAQLGDADAQFRCGVMYEEGEDTAMDDTKALYFYEKAARQGHVEAQVRCGEMYADRCYRGEGTAEDREKALYWFEKAAGQGDTGAQLSCGLMYYMGAGAAQDWDKAKMWFQKVAAQTENKDAQEVAKKALEKFF